MTGGAIWIVGGSTGIGRELALQYAGLGREVIISARSQTTLQDVASLKPDLITALPLDVTDAGAVEKAVTSLFEGGEGPGTVILGAGIYKPMSFDRYSAKTAVEMITVNYLGAAQMIEKILPHFLKSKSGRLVVIASVAGYQGLPLALAYGPSKAALINLCEGLRVELDGSGVTIQLVSPGFVKTPLTQGNKFPMPFLMEVDAAAKRIIKGVEGNSFEIAFPRRFAFILKFLRMLPYAISLPLIRKGTRG